MKTVLVDPSVIAPGSVDDTLIDPETDVLSEEEDPIEFVENEPVRILFVDSLYRGYGTVAKIHEDEMGPLIQLSVDWEGVFLEDD